MIVLKDERLFDNFYNNEIEDLRKIQKAVFECRSILLSLDESAMIWQDYSSSVSASWLCIPENSEDVCTQIESGRNFKSWGISCFDVSDKEIEDIGINIIEKVKTIGNITRVSRADMDKFISDVKKLVAK